MKASQKRRKKIAEQKSYVKRSRAAARDYWRVVYFLWACETLDLVGDRRRDFYKDASDAVKRLYGLKNGTRL